MSAATGDTPPGSRGAHGDAVLSVRDLSVHFGALSVLAELSFEVTRGSALAIIGPNGSGKTVLFRALIGTVAHGGSVTWARGVKIGYVPQKLDLARDLPITGGDFLEAKAEVSRASRAEADDVVALVGLDAEVTRRPIGALSGGQFQRLLVAGALLGQPDVLLLDEPTAGVDEPGQEALNVLVDRLRAERGLTLLLISHDLSVVYRYASNVLCLARTGVCFGPPRTVLTPEMLARLYGAPVGLHVHEAP